MIRLDLSPRALRPLAALPVFAVLGVLPAAAQEGPALDLAETEEVGRYIVGPAERPVYAFITEARAGDELPALESCQQTCREDWPLAVAPQDITVAEPLSADLAATITDDSTGAEVLVYNSYPLFYYIDDVPGGAPQGHIIHEFGGWWLLLDPSGTPIAEDVALPQVTGD